MRRYGIGKINATRVTLGGLLAGLVINVGETISSFIFGDQINVALEALGRPPLGGALVALAVVLTFVFGIVLVWLSAAVRPRFGAGPKTAIIAGLLIWVVASVFPSISYVMLGLFPTGLIAISVVWALVEIPLASVAGAWLYKET